MPEIVLTETAVSDLEGIAAWYVEQEAPEVGGRLVAEIFERIGALTVHPEMGRVVPEFGLAQLRELIHPPFRIVYQYDEERAPNEIQIVRVWRSERVLRL